jgi:hypothetical protein
MSRSLYRSSKDGRETVVEGQSSEKCILQAVEITMLSWAKTYMSVRRPANAQAELDYNLDPLLKFGLQLTYV